MTVITMSRQLGSGADQVASRLCQNLGLRVFDKRLMLQVASEVGLSESEIVDYSEDEYKLRTLVDALLRRERKVGEVTTRVAAGEGPEISTRRVLSEDLAVDLTRTTILAAHERGNVLIMGRGGQVVLARKPDVLHVRLVAPMEDRLARLQADGMDEGEARRIVQERDRATEEYLRTFYDVDVDDSTLYHLVVNSSALGMDGAVSVIEHAVKQIA